MARQHHRFYLIGVALLMMLPSCLDDNSHDLQWPTALVTVYPNADGGFVMQLNDSTKLVPVNLKASPFGNKEVRALVNYTESNVSTQDKRVRNVEIKWIDSIRTKTPVLDLGDQNDSKYGKDPLEIVQDWVTVAEDGYLTLRIRTLWGPGQPAHNLNLVTGTNPDDPYELELRHDAKRNTSGHWGDALIAFNLNGLPRTGTDKVKIKLKWKSFSGEKSVPFEMTLRPVRNQK